jgi:hypothetical protein
VAHFDTRTQAERTRDAREAAMTKSQRLARFEGMLARANAAGVARPDIEAEIAKLRRALPRSQ